ncbi:putative Tudor/PWWP/MBT superfamily protein [Quillaja saponaria]|uniref:Tudor/PWWP/MBT superfamily protein n=1 Tax=Quillaja saponaria TaxID=32244 RepID=A0AAD7QAS8_QUISA|nr:putative Tudor/PWWP/MBT superfamily protein [Quillaja saponaria]
MISVMKNGYKFDRQSDSIEESKENARVSEVSVDNSNEENYSNTGVDGKIRISSMELDSRDPGSEVDARVSGNGKSEDVVFCSTEEARVSSENGGGGVDDDMESRSSEIKHEMENIDRLDDRNDQVEARDDRIEAQKDRFGVKHNREEYHTSDRQGEVEKSNFSPYKSLFSELDDYVASEKIGGKDGGLSSYGFEVGDMVWGKVKSHPWWPGHIFNEAFASPFVRRTRTEGYVLVAFFGDSSYGWFEPAELIPFDTNYAEKSRQTNSRIFVKAVEEAVDELSRRRGLGLTCKCRNPRNFRLTTVEGYFSIDVPDYEPGGVYSFNQIRKARNSFKLNETLAFIKQLALTPRGGDHQSINFIKNKATVFAYRKAVFEQYDETYAQAFGVQPVRPSRDQVNAHDQPVKEPPRAPLSGPLVVAEALGGRKNSKKSLKVKESTKKERYLFKRRDEYGISKGFCTNQEQGSSSARLAFMGESLDAVGDYVLQKRAPATFMTHQIPSKHQETGIIRRDGAASTLNVPGKEGIADQAPPKGSTFSSHGIAVDTKASTDEEKGSLQDIAETFGSDIVVSPTNMVRSDLSRDKLEGEVSFDVKYDENAKMPKSHDDFLKHDQGFPAGIEGGNDLHQVKDGANVIHPSPIEVKRLVKKSADGVVKKPFAPGKGGSSLGKSSLKSTQIGLAPREDFQIEQLQVDIGASNSLLVDGVGNIELKLPELLSDLQALALDPFHGIERNAPATVRQFFVHFRSLIYQKSLVLSQTMEDESSEVRVIKSPGVGLAGSHDEHVRSLPPGKPVKHSVRPDDPTKVGRKRAPSDRQEEIAAKRLKKVKDLKTLAAQKKAVSQRTSEVRRGEGNESVLPAAPKSGKAGSVKKVYPPAKTVDPTLLVIKFPPQTSLPSLAELKARFARFGPIDQSGLRVFWKSFTCRVLFLHKLDAQAAYKYAVGNNSLFGNVSVRCYLREVGDPAAEAGKMNDDTIETARVKESPVVQQPASSILRKPQTKIQLKSCLKKSTGDESDQVTGNGGNSKGTPRVKFMLGGEESNRGEQLMIGNRNTFNNASFADGGASSSVAMDFNSKNFQKVISQPQLPILPLPHQFTKAPQNDLHNFEMAPRNIPNFVVTTTQSAPATTVDISQQMSSLLTRCNDVVANLTGLLGYVPYHPL